MDTMVVNKPHTQYRSRRHSLNKTISIDQFENWSRKLLKNIPGHGQLGGRGMGRENGTVGGERSRGGVQWVALGTCTRFQKKYLKGLEKSSFFRFHNSASNLSTD